MVAALAVSYALNYRKMPNPMEIGKLFLQVLITFILIYVLFEFLTHFNEISSEIPEKMDPTNKPDKIDPPVDPTDKINPPVDPTDKIDSDKPDGSTTPWYKNIKVWGGLLFAGLAAVGIYYYLKGFAPISPDDMDSFNASVSQQIANISSEQETLRQSVSEMVNTVEERVDLQNISIEEMLRDIVYTGESARRALEQTSHITEELNIMLSRASNIDSRSTVILKGLFYILGFRSAFIPNNLRGPSLLRELMSLPNPLLMDISEFVEPTARVSTSEVVEPTARVSTPPTTTASTPPTTTASTQTDMNIGRIYELISTYVTSYFFLASNLSS